MLHVCPVLRPQSRIRATSGRSTASGSARTGSCTPAALRTALCGCGRLPWARPTACGSVSCQVTSRLDAVRYIARTHGRHKICLIHSFIQLHFVCIALNPKLSLKGLTGRICMTLPWPQPKRGHEKNSLN